MFDRFACWLSYHLGRPGAVLFAAIAIAVGFPIAGLDNTNVAISIVSLMLLFAIQNSQNRDTAALNAKLDEIIHAIPKARDEIAKIDEKTEAEINMLRRERE